MRRALPLSALLLVCACGSTTSVTPSPTVDPAVRSAAAQAYSAAAATANAAKAALQAGPCLTSDNASLKACSSGLAAAEQAFENALLKITFPPDTRADADSLVAIDKRVVADEMSFAKSANPEADATDFTAIESDDKLLAAAVAAVRRDLGLAPPPSFRGSPTP
ncbi:MAG TPA: hypothetical protein VH661_01865 [Candidatus Dormibacteraeota bacterium]|nr:hypothetical protein [Candidatus Dormibacteraeota bacterium]